MREPADVPRPTRADVEERARREFPDTDAAEILAELDRYGTMPHEREVHRVHMALLKLSDGRQDELEIAVTMAKRDYRDVLAYAEYPIQMSLLPRKADGSNAEAIDRAIQADDQQYRAWLDRL